MESQAINKSKERGVLLDVFSRRLLPLYISFREGLLITWIAETSVGNISWFRFVSINWNWPFFHFVDTFIENNTEQCWLIKCFPDKNRTCLPRGGHKGNLKKIDH